MKKCKTKHCFCESQFKVKTAEKKMKRKKTIGLKGTKCMAQCSWICQRFFRFRTKYGLLYREMVINFFQRKIRSKLGNQLGSLDHNDIYFKCSDMIVCVCVCMCACVVTSNKIHPCATLHTSQHTSQHTHTHAHVHTLKRFRETNTITNSKTNSLLGRVLMFSLQNGFIRGFGWILVNVIVVHTHESVDSSYCCGTFCINSIHIRWHAHFLTL